MTRCAFVWSLLGIFAVLSSGIGVVYVKARSRALFVEVQQQRTEFEREIMEWGRLQLELASTGSLEDVSRVARGRLHMRAPAPEQVVVVE